MKRFQIASRKTQWNVWAFTHGGELSYEFRGKNNSFLLYFKACSKNTPCWRGFAVLCFKYFSSGFLFFFFTKDFLLGRDFQEEITQMGFSQRVFCPPCCDLGVGTGVTCGLWSCWAPSSPQSASGWGGGGGERSECILTLGRTIAVRVSRQTW